MAVIRYDKPTQEQLSDFLVSLSEVDSVVIRVLGDKADGRNMWIAVNGVDILRILGAAQVEVIED